MDPAMWQKLMIDQAMGALEPEMSALVLAYAEKVDGQRELNQWKKLATAASKAMSQPVRDGAGVSGRQGAQAWWRMAPIAAALLVGLGIGFVAHMQPAAEQTALVSATEPAVVSSQGASVGVSDFWSSQRILAAAMDTQRLALPAEKLSAFNNVHLVPTTSGGW